MMLSTGMARERACADQAAHFGRVPEVYGDDVRASEHVIAFHQLDTKPCGALQVRCEAPADHAHAQPTANARDAAADGAETEHAEDLALQFGTFHVLPHAVSDPEVTHRDRPCDSEHESNR